MRKVSLVAVFLLFAAGTALAQVPNTRFINLVDTPATIAFNASGTARIPIDPSVNNIINVRGFRKISVLIGSTSATSARVIIGKNAGLTLAQGFTFTLDQRIHTFDVIGPEFTIFLQGGAPNTTQQVQVWVYLTS